MPRSYFARGLAVVAMLAAAAATGWGLYAMFAGCGAGCGVASAQPPMAANMQLPLLTITGVLALLVALALIAAAFSLLDLSNNTEALGLPAGSIRAVLALALVLIFAILTIFFYSDMAAPPKKDLSAISGLTAAQAKALGSTVKVVYEKPEQGPTDPKVDTKVDTKADSKAEPKTAPTKAQNSSTKPAATAKEAPKAEPKNEPTYTVYFREPRNPAAEDFAKQVLVLIGTLVTSVTSFYFGSKGVTVTASASKPAPETLPAPTATSEPVPPPVPVTGGEVF